MASERVKEQQSERERMTQLAAALHDSRCISTARYMQVLAYLDQMQTNVYDFICTFETEECPPYIDERGYTRTRIGGCNSQHALQYFKPRRGSESTVYGRFLPLLEIGAIEIVAYLPSHDPRIKKAVRWVTATRSGALFPLNKFLCQAVYAKRKGIFVGFKHNVACDDDISSALDWLNSLGITDREINYCSKVTVPNVEQRALVEQLREKQKKQRKR